MCTQQVNESGLDLTHSVDRSTYEPLDCNESYAYSSMIDNLLIDIHRSTTTSTLLSNILFDG